MPVEKKGRDVYKSQFSMGQLDFERWTDLLKEADKHGYEFWKGNVTEIVPYFAALKQFYLQIFYIIVDNESIEEIKDSIEQEMGNIEFLMSSRNDRQVQLMIPKLRKDMEKFAKAIYKIKQLVGLGIDVEKVMSAKKKWEAAARIG